MSSENSAMGPLIVHSTNSANPPEPYEESSTVHSTVPYNAEPVPLSQTLPSTTAVPLLPPWQETGIFEIFVAVSKEVEDLNCAEWTILLHEVDTNTTAETESTNDCRAYTIESGPKDGVEKEYVKHIRTDKPFHSFDARNNNSYEHLIPCGTLQKEYLPLFDRIFWETRCGPNNFFISRFLRMLSAYGLVCEQDIFATLMHLGIEQRYNKVEIEYFGWCMTVEDGNYVMGGLDHPVSNQGFYGDLGGILY